MGCGPVASAALSDDLASNNVALNNTGPSYPIVLHRPLQAGQRFHLVESAERTLMVRVNRNGVISFEHEVHLSLQFFALQSIHRVGPMGGAVEADYVIERFTSDRGGGPTWLAQPGQTLRVIAGEGSSEPVILLDGQPCSPSIREVAVWVVAVSDRSGNDDLMYGTNTPQSIGSTWAINSRALADSWQRTGRRSVSPPNVTGHVSLRGVRPCEGRDCLVIQVGVRSTDTDSRVPRIGRDPHFEGVVEYTEEMVFPADDVAPQVESQARTIWSDRMTDPQDDSVHEIHGEHVLRWTRYPITP